MKQDSSCQLTVARNPRVISIERVVVVVTLSTCVPKVVMFGLGRKTDSGFLFFSSFPANTSWNSSFIRSRICGSQPLPVNIQLSASLHSTQLSEHKSMIL